MRASGRPKRTPCQPSETCGPETPSPSRNRPPLSTSRLAAVIAVIAGLRAGICITAEPTSIFSVCAASQASTVGLSDPYASAAHTTLKPSASACWASRSWPRGSSAPTRYPKFSPSLTATHYVAKGDDPLEPPKST